MRASRGSEVIVTASGTYVKVNQDFRPVPVGEKVMGETEEEREAIELAIQRRNDKIQKIRNKKEIACSEDPTNF